MSMRGSSSLPAMIAVLWTLMVWLNWFSANPVDFAQAGASLAAFAGISSGAALTSLLRRVPDFVVLIALAVGALGAGLPAASWLRSGGRRFPSVFVIGFGAGALSLGMLGAGFVGLAMPALAWAAAGAAAAAAVARTRGWRPGIPPAREWWFWAPVVALLGLSLTGALAPEATFDGQVHHLAHPQVYVLHHKVCGLPHHFLSYYPALTEMQYLLAWLLSGGPEAAKLVHFAWGILAFAALLGWAREKVEEPVALAAGAAFLAIPYVQLVSMWAYVDLAAAAYLTLTLRLAAARKANPAALGLLCGLCAGVKVTGVFAPVLAAGAFALRRVPARNWAVFAAACFCAAVPWGLRYFCLAGNPFAPFLSDIMPILWWGTENMARYQEELAGYRGGPDILRGLPGFLAGPWNVSVRNIGVLDSMAGMGGWFLWGFPLLALFRVRAARAPAFLALAYFCLWHLIPKQVRYLLPVWPAGMLVCALMARFLIRSGGLAAVSGWALVPVFLLSVIQAVQRQGIIGNPVRVVTGSESVESYLARGIPGKGMSLKARAWLKANQGRDSVLLANHYGLGFFWGPRAIRQSFFDTPLIERFSRESVSPERIVRKFRQYGIGLLLYDAQGGFEMQSIYRMYGFDGASAERWRLFWLNEARILANLDDCYLVYRIGSEPAGKAPRAGVSVWPGLDDQWLADLEMKLSRVERLGGKEEDVVCLEKDYLRVARDTGSPLAWERVGLMRLKLKNWAGAREALAESANRGRASALLCDGLGLAEAMLGRWNESARAFAAALAIKPGHTNARVNLARVYQRFGKKEEALRLVRDGLALEPDSAALGAILQELSR